MLALVLHTLPPAPQVSGRNQQSTWESPRLLAFKKAPEFTRWTLPFYPLVRGVEWGTGQGGGTRPEA